MINSVTNYNGSGKNRSNIAFKALRIKPESGQEMVSKLFGVKSIDLHLHEAADFDTAKAATYMYDQYESRGIKAYLCADKNELKDLGIDYKKYRIKKGSKPSEAALMLDHNGWDKVAKANKKLLENTKQIFRIDHHLETENTISAAFSYIDTTAKSCCAILYRLAQSVDEKLSKPNAEKLYTGIISDYEKSKRIAIEATPNGSQIVKLEALNVDKNSAEILGDFEKILTPEERIKVHNQLDIIPNLTPAEQAFRKDLFSRVQITSNGKMAYAVIDPKEKYVDDTTHSTILRDLRLRLINGVEHDELFSAEQKAKFKGTNDKIKIDGAIIFYPVAKVGKKKKAYQFSIHSKKDSDYAQKWTDYVRGAYKEKESKTFSLARFFMSENKHKLIAGGHSNRSGGRIGTFDKTSIKNLIESFKEAGENVE